MKVVYIYGGSTTLGDYFSRRKEKVLYIPWDQVREWDSPRIVKTLKGRPSVILACPNCSTYSIAGLGHHRMKKPGEDNLYPKTMEAREADRRNEHILSLIRTLSPRLWIIENPRGGLRKMKFMEGLPRYTTTYCQYGDSRMKPTDFWTNHPPPGI